MTRNLYVDLCLNVQATRRYFESIRTPLAAAVGVAASMYTHQLGNVLRVLTDVRVRHLLADEVGLGKTVQALMVLNALRYQRPELRALIVVPDRLVTQWRDEIMTRAHTAPIGEVADEAVEGRQYIRLAWEAQLRMSDAGGNPRLRLSDIDPDQFDVLIVDELHHLRGDVQDRIVRVAMDFEHLLVLTATPAFQRAERHAQLFALLEPERTALERWRIARSDRGASEQLSLGDDISKWPAWATTHVVKAILDRDAAAAASSAESDLASTAMAFCAYRRVIRTRRTDYSGVLPRRSHRPLVVDPIGAEADRQSLMWEYFGYLEELSRRFDPVLLAKRVILSPPSLEQRIDFLRREGHERAGLLEAVKPLVYRAQGDSRADALIDLLADVWSRNISERVLVAAQDNLTVDYLFDLVRARLPVIGPVYHRIPLVAARVRQGMMTEAVEDLDAFGNETSENLDAFQRGEAQVLFAPEAAQVGLNLQCARVLILYSVPWRPEEVEQWIGRLDRIGNAAAFSKEGDAKTVDVYTIVQRGLVDEKVVTVLQRFRAFERSVNLDGDHLEEVAQRIEAAALRPERVNWRELEEATELMAAQDEVQELKSDLRAYLPWTVHWATRQRQRFETLPPAPPVLRELTEHSSRGPRAWGRAFEGMLQLLAQAGDYHIRWNTDPRSRFRFKTLWYQFGARMYGQRDVNSKVIFSFGADPGHERSPRYAHAFITRRGDIATPPHRSVTLSLDQEEVRRPLRFLSFGDALHDELVMGWMVRSDEPVMLDVAFPDDHFFWDGGKSGLYFLRVSILDPALAIAGHELQSRQAILQAATLTPPERLDGLVQTVTEAMRCAVEADVRWLRHELGAMLDVEAWWEGLDGWVAAGAEVTKALLNPAAHGGSGLPEASELRAANSAEVSVVVNQFRIVDATAAQSAWGHRMPDFEQALAARLLIVREEGRDATSLAIEEMRRSEAALEDAIEQGNRAQITRVQNARDGVADTLHMIEVLWQQRELWLQECLNKVRSVKPSEHLTALLRVRRAG